MASSPSQHYWNRAIARLQRRVNAAAWAEQFAPVAFGVGSVAALALYGLRRSDRAVSSGWLVLAAGLLAAGVIAGWRTRRRFFNRTDARVFLEYHLHLDAGLSAAEAGMAPWPPAALPSGRLLQWRARGTLGWLAATTGLVLAAVWLPVPARSAFAGGALEKPPALAETEAWLRQLAQLAAVEPATVEPLTERVRELGRQSPEKQYTHSALEAADALRDQTAAAMAGLARDLDAAAGALAPLAETPAALTPDRQKQLGRQLEAALRGLRDGPLGARAELLKSLALSASAAQAGTLASLSPEQLLQLQRSLKQGGREIRGVLGAAGEGAVIALAGVSAGGSPGRGGVSRGPGEAPLSFADKPSDAGPGQSQALAGADLSRAAPGDLLGTSLDRHELDPARSESLTSAGAASVGASGGEAVWIDRLTPAERAALKSFFK